jgi:hypothetical protein
MKNMPLLRRITSERHGRYTPQQAQERDSLKAQASRFLQDGKETLVFILLFMEAQGKQEY